MVQDSEIFDRCLSKYGMSKQMTKLSEESCELAIAVMKWSYQDYAVSEETIDEISDIAEEIADVEIMIDQLKYFVSKRLKEFGISDENHLDKLIFSWREFKLDRVMKRMDAAE